MNATSVLYTKSHGISVLELGRDIEHLLRKQEIATINDLGHCYASDLAAGGFSREQIALIESSLEQHGFALA
ncbi:MAG: hypothetical protein A2808_03190 [Candidatus Moranbacteria bacterium RIFCSPHIGHO2_01_FULL_55_24]|nr:MAG: hypothetical protein A2808_03190 [Candidatus Moranbacteria bacterium RIFCSPHIGHO2_01_FULL_55_24]